jgi:hypothetical protein
MCIYYFGNMHVDYKYNCSVYYKLRLYEVDRKGSWTWVRLPPGPPVRILFAPNNSEKNSGVVLVRGSLAIFLLMGLPWFRQGQE